MTNVIPAKVVSGPTLTDLLNATSISSSRSRAIVFIIISASIIAFFAEWKAMPFGWYGARIGGTAAAVDYFDQSEGTDDAKWQARKATRQLLLGLSADNEDAWKAHLDRGREVARTRGFLDAAHARAYLNALETTRLDTVTTLHLPILGISFDVNDLGMVAGIGFFVLLVTLLMALGRELRNLRIAFAKADEAKQLKDAYEYLSMSQVMTIPPSVGARPGPRPFWLRAPMFVMWLPFFVQLLICGDDIFTMHRAEIHSRSLTLLTLLLSFASVFLVLMVTALCWHLSGQIDHEWAEASHKIRHSSPGGPGQKTV